MSITILCPQHRVFLTVREEVETDERMAIADFLVEHAKCLPQTISAELAPVGYSTNILCGAAFAMGHPLCSIGRSSQWSTLRKKFVKEHPLCCITGLQSDIDVHHVKPFHNHPELELDWANLRSISRPYHYLIGHFCNWQSFNSKFDEHVDMWRELIAKRPKN